MDRPRSATPAERAAAMVRRQPPCQSCRRRGWLRTHSYSAAVVICDHCGHVAHTP